MRKSGRNAEKETPKGAHVDELLGKIRALIAELEAKEATLTKYECVKAYAHFKTGTNKMYLLSPSENGGRQFTYIGVDPSKQQIARGMIARYEEREGVRRRIRTLTGELTAAVRDLEDLYIECARIVTMEGSDQNGIFRFGDRARRRIEASAASPLPIDEGGYTRRPR